MKLALQRPTLSLCMIVKNEERWIERCLRSVESVVDEMIVVDTGSGDSTPSIASALGARLFHHQWQDDFSEAKNFALGQAHGEWILVLDADEELESESGTRLKGLIADTAAEGFQLCVRNLLPPGEILKFEDLYITRLFRNRPEHRYAQPIHEQIRPSIERRGGPVRRADLTILHHGYAQRTAQGQGRADRNLRLLEAAVTRAPNDAYLHYQLGATHKSLGNSQKAHAFLRQTLALDYRALESETQDRLFTKLSQLALASDNYPAAVGYARESLRLNPANLVSLYVEALSLLFQGKVPEAYLSFLQIREQGKDNLGNREELDAVLAHCHQMLPPSVASALSTAAPTRK